VYYLYLNDNDSVGPKGFSYSDPSWFDWRLLGGYLGIRENAEQEEKMAVTCPNGEWYMFKPGATTGTTYAVNAYLGYEKYLGEGVDAPAATPMIMDGLANDWEYPENGIRWYQMALPNGWGFILGDLWFLDQATINHEGTGNFLFFDGHAENQEELDTVGMYRFDLGWCWYGGTVPR
jgi:prepilin-type processing-associated H-X9-DG protein